MNRVRKQICALKGGGLAVAAHNATKVTLAVSDVPAGKESALASGPTLPHPTTVADAKRIIAEHSLYGKFPTALPPWLDEGEIPQTPQRAAATISNPPSFP